MNRLASTLALGGLLASSQALAGVTTVDKGELDDAYKARRVALLIGVDTYDDGDLTTLQYAAKDARDMARVLSDSRFGGYDDVHIVASSGTDRAGLLRAIQDATADLQRDDTFLLYLSGHGTLTIDAVDGTQLYFLPSDATLDNPSAQGIEVAWLEETLASLPPRRRVLIMDTCHNGRGRSAVNNATANTLASLRGEPPAPNAVAQVTESEARLFAAQYHQPAIESDEFQNGVYTHYLIESLTEARVSADLNRDGLVDVTEAQDYAQDRTIRHTGGMQVPRAEYSISGRERIFLSGDPSIRRNAENALVSAYTGLLASAQLFIDGRSRGALPGVVPIEPGTHTVRIANAQGKTIVSRKLKVRAGEHVQLESMLEPHRDEWSVSLGAALTHGSSGNAVSPWYGELQVGWRPRLDSRRVHPGFFARVDIGSSSYASSSLGSNVGATYGMAGVGIWAAIPIGRHVALGPQAEGLFTWQLSSFEGDSRLHYAPTAAAGVRFEARVSLSSDNDLILRYDGRVLPLIVEDSWTATYAHGLTVGASFR